MKLFKTRGNSFRTLQRFKQPRSLINYQHLRLKGSGKLDDIDERFEQEFGKKPDNKFGYRGYVPKGSTVESPFGPFAHVLQADEGLVVFNGYGNGCFQIGTQTFYGDCIAFDKFALQWNTEKKDKFVLDDFKIFELVTPAIDILVIGTGVDHVEPDQEICRHLRKKMKLEILNTRHALSTFNFLNIEGRKCALAMRAIPVDPNEL